MTPIRTPSCNFTYTAPSGMTDEECGPLPCLRDLDESLVISWWKPSDLERQQIANGGLIVLTTSGRAHPPVSISSCPTP